VVSFTPQPLHPWRKGLRYVLDRRLGGPQNRFAWRREEKKPTHTRLEIRPLGRPVTSRYIDCAVPAPTHMYSEIANLQQRYQKGSPEDGLLLNIWAVFS
jgi:hypothetical protein